jgi:uncharacterized protein (TIGR02996 family)
MAMIDLLKEPLFAEVLAHPDDEKPRLVLADRLLEAGDPRGEFIQLQCAVEREADVAKARDLKERAQKILKKNQPAWLKPIKPHVRYTIFRRGFVDHYLAEPKLLFDGGMATVLRHQPVRSLRIQSMKRGDAKKLAGMTELVRLASLDVGSNRIDDADAIALFSSPNLASLRSLQAARNLFSDAAVEALARSPHLAGLKVLDLADSGGGRAKPGPRGVAAIAAAAFVPRLEYLSISRGAVWETDGPRPAFDPSEFAPLLQAPLTSLRRLMIWSCKIGDQGARWIAESPHLGKLEELRCVGCEIGVDGMRAIARSKTLGALRWFEPFAGDRAPAAVADELRARFTHLG